MNNEYSETLYLLYKDGRKHCDEFEKVVDFLIEDESGIDQFLEGFRRADDYLGISHIGTPQLKKTNIRDFNDKPLKESYDSIKNYHDKWRRDVLAVLTKIPQVSFRMRFDEPSDKSSTSNVVGRFNYEFSKDMEDFLNIYDNFCDEVDELFSIINDYEKSIPKVSESSKQETPAKNIIYRLHYDAMQGKLYLNDEEIYKSNLDSKLDKALSSAFKAPETVVKTNGSVASALDAIKMPKDLKKLVFRVSKNSFKVCPEVTDDDLKRAKLNKETLDREIQNLSK